MMSVELVFCTVVTVGEKRAKPVETLRKVEGSRKGSTQICTPDSKDRVVVMEGANLGIREYNINISIYIYFSVQAKSQEVAEQFKQLGRTQQNQTLPLPFFLYLTFFRKCGCRTGLAFAISSLCLQDAIHGNVILQTCRWKPFDGKDRNWQRKGIEILVLWYRMHISMCALIQMALISLHFRCSQMLG